MRAFTHAFVATTVLAVGCAHLPAAPAAPEAGEGARRHASWQQTLAAAHDQLRRGCYDCLREALAGYRAAIDDPGLTEEARGWAVRTALLLAVRENEIGLVDGGYLALARELAGPAADAPVDLLGFIELAELVATGPVGGSRAAVTDGQLKAMLQLAQTQERWEGLLRPRAGDDVVASYLWIAVVCGPYGSRLAGRDAREEALGGLLDVPLIAYKHRTACGVSDPAPLEELVAADPRFREIDYYLGLVALGSQRHVEPNLDLAEAHFSAAQAWREDWPSVLLALANVAMLVEDFPRALDLFDRVVALAPGTRRGSRGASVPSPTRIATWTPLPLRIGCSPRDETRETRTTGAR
ncbi:MAG: hypothetical protein AB7J63_01425 [Vicinamibacterales bacterium]